ncbi:hypothetical protein STEG23_033646 [Scotinomys teguina]
MHYNFYSQIQLIGFITDGNSFLLGNVLLRQIRIPNGTLFPLSLHEQVNSQPQHQEDRENYGVSWGPSDTNITETDSIWHYQNQELLGGSPTQGESVTYSGGGYAVRLGRNSTAAARFISFSEALKVNTAVTHLMGFLVLLATVQLWDLLRKNAQLQVISKTLSKAWDEVVGFILIIMILLSAYAMTFNLLFGWSISDYQTFFSSTVTVVGLLMGISNYKEVIALFPILGSFLVLTSIILMGLVIINLFVSAILIVFGKERKALEKEATLTDVLLQTLSSLLGIRQHQNPSSEKHADNTGSVTLRVSEESKSRCLHNLADGLQQCKRRMIP